ncbi:50S ribosomal protein L17 [uncultured delta proteobacterium]|uniref:Large ribosomal subunit protein bL17 n=1 Tax=uncultured delta proteobacterium TaxID=34034 RepID=A0A212KEV5_9DELT|nr:50S ribosomal protein L17 [uncultured delta proteobacterium]
MRHRNSGRKLSRTPAHRKALFRNMAKALLTYGRITTTEAKAKEIRGVVEPLITLGLQNDLHARRQAYRVLGCHKLVKRLFDDIAPAYAGIPGGFTRISKLALPRKGDAAPMAVIELLKETPAPADAADAKPKKVAKPKAAKPKEEGAEDAKKSKAPAKPRATKAAAPKAARAPKAAPKASAPKKMKIGGE